MSALETMSICNKSQTPIVLNQLCGVNQEEVISDELILVDEVRINGHDNMIINIEYTQDMCGNSYLIVDNTVAEIILCHMLGVPSDQLEVYSDEIKSSAICELMNQLQGNVLNQMAQVLNINTDMSCPKLITQDLKLVAGTKLLINTFKHTLLDIHLKLITILD